MRVLIVGCDLDPMRRSGEELLDGWPTLAAVAGTVARAGAGVDVLQAAHRDSTLERDGATFRFVAEPRAARIPGTRGGAGVLPWRLARAAAALRPDVVHLNGLAFPLHARALGAPRRPVLVQDHKDAPPRRRVAVHRWGLRRVAGAAFTAREQAAPFLRSGVLPPSARIFEVPESSTRFTPGDTTEARAVTGVYGDPVAIWVGRLDANKDPLTILDAVALASRRLPDLRLWCCFADAPLLPRVRARLDADPALAARVHLLGRVPHARVEPLLRAADFLLLGSGHEGSAFAVLEALACGVTPILSDIPAFRSLTGRGSVGALVPRGDAPAFADALVSLSARPRDELRLRALAHFQRELSFAALGRRLLDVYGQIREEVGR